MFGDMLGIAEGMFGMFDGIPDIWDIGMWGIVGMFGRFWMLFGMLLIDGMFCGIPDIKFEGWLIPIDCIPMYGIFCMLLFIGFGLFIFIKLGFG